MSDDTGGGWLGTLLSGARFGKFASVGAVGALCDTAVLVVLTQVFGLLEEAAVLAGIEVAILVMFALNEGWTYRDAGREGWRARARRLGRSHAVRAGGTLVQFLVFVTVYRLLFTPVTLAGLDLWLLVAKGSGIALGMVVNYALETLFTWRVQSLS